MHPSRNPWLGGGGRLPRLQRGRDRKSTRLNSSHLVISYAVFCLKKKTNLVFEASSDETPRRMSWTKPVNVLVLLIVVTNAIVSPAYSGVVALDGNQFCLCLGVYD